MCTGYTGAVLSIPELFPQDSEREKLAESVVVKHLPVMHDVPGSIPYTRRTGKKTKQNKLAKTSGLRRDENSVCSFRNCSLVHSRVIKW